MKKRLKFGLKNGLTLLLLLCVVTLASAQNRADAYQFNVDLTKVTDDKLTVELIVPETVRKEKTVQYHLPKIVPGTYSIYNFGRFATDLKAYNKSGKEIKAKDIKHSKADPNTWTIKNAKNLYRIVYTVEDTWDTDRDRRNSDDFVFEPGGTNIEANKNFVINNHGFFGYFEGFKQRDFYLTFERQPKFFGATSLDKVGGEGNTDVFFAPNYMDLVDAPIMYCLPDTTTIKVGNADVLIAVYSPNGTVKADFIAGEISPILQAQKAYLGGMLPVNKYAFIIYLSDTDSYSGKFGALEHSYSSFYYLPEMEQAQIAQTVRDVAAHEFFHIVTPLNIHSEEIQNFDFINPEMSMHLWLYEGVTEYSAGHVQVSEGLMPLEDYLKVVEDKIRNAERYKDDLPFTEMSSNVLTKHKDEYGNVYEKGALIGLCLDIRLRELSSGKMGLQDVMRKLSNEFGKQKAFKDEALFEVITALTYPEIGEFLKTYVAGSTPLPIEEYMENVGLAYFSKKMVKDISPFGGDLNGFIGVDYSRMRLKVTNEDALDAFGKDFIGFKKGDVIMEWNGENVQLENVNEVLGKYVTGIKEGQPLNIKVLRGEETVSLETTITAIDVEKSHVILPAETAEQPQLDLRKSWLGNYTTGK
jgi:predicted metalloprotease with PDZ domain